MAGMLVDMLVGMLAMDTKRFGKSSVSTRLCECMPSACRDTFYVVSNGAGVNAYSVCKDTLTFNVYLDDSD